MTTIRPPLVDYRVTKLQEGLETINGKDEATVNPAVSIEEVEDDYQDYLVKLFHPTKGTYLIDSVKRNSHILCELSEQEIAQEADVKERDQLLRMSFWEEVTRAENERTPIRDVNIWRGICSKIYWDRVVREYDHKMAYVLTPIRKKRLMNKLIHHNGLGCLQAIMEAPLLVKNKFGNKVLDHKTAKLQIEAFKLVDERLHGQAVQRLEKHTINQSGTGQLTPEEAQKKLAELQKQMGSMPLTVEAEVVE